MVKSVLQKNATMLTSLSLNSAHEPLLGVLCCQTIHSTPFPSLFTLPLSSTSVSHLLSLIA